MKGCWNTEKIDLSEFWYASISKKFLLSYANHHTNCNITKITPIYHIVRLELVGAKHRISEILFQDP